MTAQPEHMETANILIVEDEVLIADTIQMNLERNNYTVVGIAISYEEAIAAIERTQPDVVLLDIRLNGSRTGVDVANYLRSLSQPPPFIFLTSQMDDYYLELAKQTFPAAYLSKPIQINSLLATLKMVAYNASAYQKPIKTVEFRHNGVMEVVRLPEICFLKSEHVYVRVHLHNEHSLLERGTISDVLQKLNNGRFVQVHRSYAVNLDRITGHDNASLYFGKQKVPVSRSRRQAVFELLK